MAASESDIWLRYFLTEDLFLVGDNTEDEPEDQLPPYTKNKSLLVLLRADHTGKLPEQNALFLKKVLQAINLSENDYVTVYLPDHQYNVPGEILQYNPVKVIIFDGAVRPRNLPDGKYKVLDHRGIKWLMADKLEEISADVKKKKALWSALKEMFDLG
jgi:DNA polymerase III psi subunit